MRRIVHISDLHFGQADAAMAATLAKTVRDLKPDLVVISGDITQRARSREFREALAFIEELPAPLMVVPGNHDIPAAHHSPFGRFFDPFRRWRKHIGHELEPSFEDEEIMVLGVNTVHPWTVKGGKVTALHAHTLKKRLKEAPPKAVKILVAHHPFDVLKRHSHSAVKGGEMLMRELAEPGIDMILAGHVHEYHIGHSAERYEVKHRSALLVQAGTAISDRTRHETNSFNLLLAEFGKIAVVPHLWDYDEKAYIDLPGEEFVRSEHGWSPV